MKAIFNAILLMLSLTITVAATAGISEIKLDNGGIYTLKITDGMSGKTLEGVLSKNNADELQWKGVNGIICHIKNNNNGKWNQLDCIIFSSARTIRGSFVEC